MKKTTISLVLAVIITLSSSMTAFAAPADNKAESNKLAKEKLEQMIDKFNKLSESEKEQIYKIDANISGQMIDLALKYAELGIITNDEAKDLIKKIDDRRKFIKENGLMAGIPHLPGIQSKMPKTSS
jgi:flagellar biosynthesis component FlhA